MYVKCSCVFFLRIADFTDPRHRMVQTVWRFLSALLAGRRSKVAKKPYDSIVGEIFRCWWDVDDIHKSKENSYLVPDGLVPWCSTNQLTLIAETQHPPGAPMPAL